MARPSYSLGIVRPKTLVFSALIGAALTAFINAVTLFKLRMVESGIIIGMTLNAGAKGGTFSVGTIAVKNGANTVGTFDAAALVAGTPADIEGANLANTSIAKDALLSAVTAESGGTSPTWKDVTISVDYIPTGD